MDRRGRLPADRQRQLKPPPSAIQEIGIAFGEDKFHVGGELADLDGELVAEEMLLEPHLVETRRGCGLEIGYRHQTVDIIGGDTAAVNLEGIHVKAEALP